MSPQANPAQPPSPVPHSIDSTRNLNLAATRPRRVYSRGERVVLTLVAAGFLAALALVALILSGELR